MIYTRSGRRATKRRSAGQKQLFCVLLFLYLSIGCFFARGEQATVNEDYFKAIRYEWTDEQGSKRVSNLAEPATEYNQIVAFLREVYVNPLVPGFLKDKAWDGSMTDAEGNVLENPYVEVPYGPCLGEGNPYGMTEDTVVEKPYQEGATAMIVELMDDYVFDSDDDCEQMLRKIKRITLLAHQRYVDIGVSKQNPGYLFNFVGTLNRFFIITKGNNRIALNSATGHAPFYHMFEEFSPSNSHPIYSAFADMDAGDGFAVDHNCTSIMGQNHIIVMSPDPSSEGYDPADNRDYAVNFMFFLPDYRFAGDSRVEEGNSYEGGWYTYYSPDHKPYFFFNKIIAEIPEAPVFVSADRARVKLQWESTYNGIVGYAANEDFYIYRVVNDVIETEPITDYEIIAPGGEGEQPVKNDDGSMTSRYTTNSVYLYEPRARFGYDVCYIVMGRRYLTDFELTESNMVDTTIPGTVDPPDALNIVIDGSRTSAHDLASRTNSYTHVIDMFDTTLSDEVTLRRKHLKATSEAGVERGTTFRLMRIAGDGGEAETVASIEITDVAEDNRWNQYLYSYRATDAEGNEIETAPDQRFKTQYHPDDRALDDEMPVIAPDNNNHILARITDRFRVSTAEGSHPASYHYYIDYDPAVMADGSAIEYNAESNVVDFMVPHNDLKAGYIPYSEKEIADDGDYALRVHPNKAGLQFTATTNPNVESYTIYRTGGGRTGEVARVRRMSTGRLVIERVNASGKLDYYTSVYKTDKPTIELVDATVEAGDEFDLVVRYNNKNSYGNRISVQRPLPYPVIDELELRAASERANGDDTEYTVRIDWYSDGMGDPYADDSFAHCGYRAWGHHNATGVEGHYTVHNSVAGPDEPEAAKARIGAADPDATVSVDHDFKAHEATYSRPVDFHTAVRLYARLPESMKISEGDAPGYVVVDSEAERSMSSYTNVPTGIDGISGDNPDAEPEYYDLRGIRLTEPAPGTIVIRRQGGEAKLVRTR